MPSLAHKMEKCQENRRNFKKKGDIEMEKRIEDVLIDIGIYPHLLGFNYICKAVSYLMENNAVKMCVLYEMIADECESTAYRVERAIRTALSKADQNCETYKKYMSVNNKSNAAMLFTLATRLKIDKEEEQ